MSKIDYVAGEIVPAGSGPRLPDRYDPRDVREQMRQAWMRAQRSANTAEAYGRDLSGWFAWCDENDVDPFDARRFHVDTYRHHLDDTGLQASTVARKLTSISSFYEHAIGESRGAVRDNPVARVKRPVVGDESTTSGLSLEEAHQLLAAAQAQGVTDYAIIAVLLHSGLRVSELCAATTRDLETVAGELMLWVTGKGGKRQRVHIPGPAASALRDALGDRRGPLFVVKGERMHRYQIAYIIEKAAQRAGLVGPDIERRLSPHSMRHTAATLALNAGVPLRDVQDMMRHADPRTTNRYDRARRSIERSPGHVLGRILASDNEVAE